MVAHVLLPVIDLRQVSIGCVNNPKKVRVTNSFELEMKLKDPLIVKNYVS